MSNIKIYAENLDEAAANQIEALAALPPFEHSRIRVMPDAHAGKGCVIGFTANVADAVIPNVVGVDVGCGVYAARLDAECTEGLARKLDAAAHAAIPTGFLVHKKPQIDNSELDAYECSAGFHDRAQLLGSLGTLGGGNHFIELDRGPAGEPWLVIHTGSRGIGAQLASWWQAKATAHWYGPGGGASIEERRELIARLKQEGRETEIESALAELTRGPAGPRPAEDQCWLEGDERDGYLHDMALAQAFAARNRRHIAELLCAKAGVELEGREIESVHNYIDLEAGIIRKGAISAQCGEQVVIPLNMAAGCAIGTGRGEEDWNFSAPHGAGRALSRKAAMHSLSMDEFRTSMEGVYSTTVCESTIDEAPMAYKDPGTILSSLAPTVEVAFVMRPVWNFKATGNGRR